MNWLTRGVGAMEIEIQELYVTYKPLLFSLAYRMLGSVMDAEDMVQDIFIAIDKVDTTKVTNVKAFLCKMVTNRCIDYLRSARSKREVYVGPWLPEPILTGEGGTDPAIAALVRDDLSIAYLTMMEHLTETERAVLVLREALGFDYPEIAEMVGKSEANCRKILSRVKKKLGNQAEDQTTSVAQHAQLIQDFLQAITDGDVKRVLTLLTTDAVLYSDGGGIVKAALNPIITGERVAAFLTGVAKKRTAAYTYQFVEVNGRPGFVGYSDGQIHSVWVFELRDGRIDQIYAVLNPEKLRHIRQSS
ncbi:MAG TPA: RNA polymerase sigma-70 factor [Candidatus Bathyarchaeia archaeon]|nr:RNA polymerase sigma-70 factor [Candidatus Bathyarchaeia archaeon]